MAKTPTPTMRWKSSGNFHKLMDDRYALPVATITVTPSHWSISVTCFADRRKDFEMSYPSSSISLVTMKAQVQAKATDLNPMEA